MGNSAIGIIVEPSSGSKDFFGSKFYGSPCLPKSMAEEGFDDGVMFLCQIRLDDIASLDEDNQLPHEGYLYVFVDTSDGKYQLKADVRLSKASPEVIVDDFNASVPGYEQYIYDHKISFKKVLLDEDCTRLLGVPSDWNYPDPAPALLLQLDPYDENLHFHPELDGFIYIFFGENHDIKTAYMKQEYA